MRAWPATIWSLLVTTYREFSRNRGPLSAGAIAFSSALALVPIALLTVTIMGRLLGSRQAFEDVAALLPQVLPGVSRQVLAALRDYTASGGRAANVIGAIGFLWAASNLFAVLSSILTTIWVGVDERGFLMQRFVGLLALLVGGVLFLLNVVLGSLLHAGDGTRLSEFLHAFGTTLPWLLNAFLIAVAIFLVYRFLPRGRVSNRAALLGTGPATVLWLLCRYLFSVLVAGSAHYGRVYGPLAGTVVLLLWIYYSAYVLLLCAELGASAQERFWPTPRDRPGMI